MTQCINCKKTLVWQTDDTVSKISNGTYICHGYLCKKAKGKYNGDELCVVNNY